MLAFDCSQSEEDPTVAANPMRAGAAATAAAAGHAAALGAAAAAAPCPEADSGLNAAFWTGIHIAFIP